MVALLVAEVRRLAARRLVRVATLAALTGIVVLLTIFVARSDPSSFGGDVMRTTTLWLTRGEAASLGVQRDNALVTIAVLSYLLVVVIGASATGADYRAGTMTTLLTWEPRRIRLLLVRMLAVAIVTGGLFLTLQVVFAGGWALGAELRGRTDGADLAFWREVGAVMLRGTVVAVAFGVISAAIATVGRNTSAALGIWFGYLVVVEGILRGLASSTVPWFLTLNVAALYAWEPVEQLGHVVEPGAALGRVALFVVVVAGGALAVFRRRDVI
jgi:hypothetical protein